MLAVADQPVAVLESKTLAAYPRTSEQERRETDRLRRKLEVTVRPVGFSESLVGRARDLSEGGMYLLLHAPAMLTVGQRCELQLTPDGDVPAHICGECHYATVVRTEPVTYGEASMFGAGLRFDQPLFLS